MLKRWLSAFVAAVLVCLSLVVSADEVKWTFAVPLRDCIGPYALLVNEQHMLDASYKPQSLTKVTNASGIKRATKADVFLEDTMLSALKRMFEAASQVTEYEYVDESGKTKVAEFPNGMTLYLKSGYRSYGTQKTTYANHLEKTNNVDDGYVAKPGASEHQSGLCADILNAEYSSHPTMTQDFKYTPEAQWMKENCASFGFILRYTEEGEQQTGISFEPWHFRYVGVNIARYIATTGESFEQFSETAQQMVEAFRAAGGDEEAQCALELRQESPLLQTQVLDIFDETGDAEVSISY